MSSAYLSELPGVKKPLQKRSINNQSKIIAVSHELFCGQDYDAISIQSIAQAANCSVGTVYSRFENKAVLFLAVQEIHLSNQLEQARYDLNQDKWKNKSSNSLLKFVIEYIVSTFCGDTEGILRNSLVQSTRNPEFWTPMYKAGAKIGELVVDLLLERLDTKKHKNPKTDILFIIQIIYGTLTNAILNNPGPYSLDDPELTEQLHKLVSGYLTFKK